MPKFTLQVNGQSRPVDVPADTPLLWVLRDTSDSSAPNTGAASANVALHGPPRRRAHSLVLAPLRRAGQKITTIEGLAGDDGHLHALQPAWFEHDVAQCGYCQAGQIMSASALLKRKPDPTVADIDAAMTGNICRCGTYYRIRQGIQRAAAIASGNKEAAS